MAVTSANANAPGPASPMGCPYRWAAMPIPTTTTTIMTMPTGTTTPLARGMSITTPLTPTPTTRLVPAPCASRVELPACLVAAQVLWDLEVLAVLMDRGFPH